MEDSIFNENIKDFLPNLTSIYPNYDTMMGSTSDDIMYGHSHGVYGRPGEDTLLSCPDHGSENPAL